VIFIATTQSTGQWTSNVRFHANFLINQAVRRKFLQFYTYCLELKVIHFGVTDQVRSFVVFWQCLHTRKIIANAGLMALKHHGNFSLIVSGFHKCEYLISFGFSEKFFIHVQQRHA
jgi:hypothetical protein